MTSAFAPGRVNVIGDHTDHTGGLCLPMAIQLGTTIDGERGGAIVHLTSAAEPEPAIVPIDVVDPSEVRPSWAQYVAAVVAEVRPTEGFVGHVSTTLPIGAGLSSSAALEVALALALGFEGQALDLARLCRRAEHRAAGVPCGIMDQLASVAGVEGHLLRIDCRDEAVQPVALPAHVRILGVDSRQPRSLAGSAYGDRRAECAQVEAEIGPLRDATAADAAALRDPALRRRARHVISENARVDAFVGAVVAGDLAAAGVLMAESHRSLSDDFAVSTPEVDRLVAHLARTPGVLGARMTGGGFGGTIVVLAEPGASVDGTELLASAGAHRTS